MPRRNRDNLSPGEATDIRSLRTDSSSTVRSVGFSDTVAPNGRTVLRQPISIHTQPPATRQRTDIGPGGDESGFPDLGTIEEGTIVQITAPPKKARRNNFFVSTVRLLI